MNAGAQLGPTVASGADDDRRSRPTTSDGSSAQGTQQSSSQTPRPLGRSTSAMRRTSVGLQPEQKCDAPRQQRCWSSPAAVKSSSSRAFAIPEQQSPADDDVTTSLIPGLPRLSSKAAEIGARRGVGGVGENLAELSSPSDCCALAWWCPTISSCTSIWSNCPTATLVNRRGRLRVRVLHGGPELTRARGPRWSLRARGPDVRLARRKWG
jgi:hypothetical protein